MEKSACSKDNIYWVILQSLRYNALNASCVKLFIVLLNVWPHKSIPLYISKHKGFFYRSNFTGAVNQFIHNLVSPEGHWSKIPKRHSNDVFVHLYRTFLISFTFLQNTSYRTRLDIKYFQVIRPSYLYNENYFTGKTASLYWDATRFHTGKIQGLFWGFIVEPMRCIYCNCMIY